MSTVTQQKVLGTSHKVQLSEGVGVVTGVLYLSPANESGFNMCPSATAGCAAACLGHSSGHMVFPTHLACRIRKTHQLMRERPLFMAQLRKDIAAIVRRAARNGMTPAVRLNGSSDIGWERLAPELFTEFPQVTFYDYTKRFRRMEAYLSGKFPPNYRLTFSRSGENDTECMRVLWRGGNVAAVFAKKSEFPATHMGARVISGEEHDYRYGDPRGVIIALKARGKAGKDTSGFVIRL